MNMQRTICLNMIVKDEQDVIERCLLSVKKLLDYWVIVDTGSSDLTKSLILSALKDIPGELHDRSWVNFQENRNQALELARGKSDYILFMDADETLDISSEFKKSELSEDFYLFRLIERSHTDFYRVSLIRDLSCWFWTGLYHEAIDSRETMSGRKLETIVKYGCTKDGNQSKNPRKFLQEAEWIEDALAKDPGNSRYIFYLAQSYGNAKMYEKSLGLYQQRVGMNGDAEEIFWSYYCMGMIQQHLKKPQKEWLDSYTKAYCFDTSRLEPLLQIARYFQAEKQYLLGYSIAKMGLPIQKPFCSGYFHAWVYDYALELVFAECASMLGRKEEAKKVYLSLLQKKDLSPDIQGICHENLSQYDCER